MANFSLKNFRPSELILVVVFILIGICLFGVFLVVFQRAGGNPASDDGNPLPAIPFVPGVFASPAATRTGTRTPKPTETPTSTNTSTRTPAPTKYTQVPLDTWTPEPSLTPNPNGPIVVIPNGSGGGVHYWTNTPDKPRRTDTPIPPWPRPTIEPCGDIPLGGIGPSDDAWIDSTNQGANFKTDKSLNVKNADSQVRHALLRFNLTSFSGAARAILYLNVRRPGTGQVSVYRVSSAWSEASATWKTALSGPWGQPGGDYNNGAPIDTFSTRSGCFVSINLTTLVQSWIANPASNFGILLAAADNGMSQTVFASKEKSGQHPSLVIH